MQINLNRKDQTTAVVDITASEDELSKIKTKVLNMLAPQVKISGFRDGKAPIEMIEKSIDQQKLQTEFLNEAINMFYVQVLKSEKLRPVGQPNADIKKFVPYSTLELTLTIPVVGEIKLPDYKKTKVKREDAKITDKDITNVLDNLKVRSAKKNEVKRKAKNGDEAWIDFKGTDNKGEEVQGASGTDYPLVLGSKTFIPGFEDEVEGMDIGEEKSFEVTFPKDYGSKALQNQKVTFAVTLKKVNEVVEPELNDEFAASVGPFKSMDELKDDIKKQLEHEAKHKAERDYEAALVKELSEKTDVEIPQVLIEEQEELVMQEVRQNVVQRGMTYDEYLKSLGMTDDEYKKKEVSPEAVRRIKAGLLLSEIADVEGIDVTPEELEARLQQLKGQYQDKQMQEQLDTPDARREINARLRSEKVIAFLKK